MELVKVEWPLEAWYSYQISWKSVKRFNVITG